jgi:hypothetical protein
VSVEDTRTLGLVGNIIASPNAMLSIFLPPIFCFALSFYAKTLYTFFHRTYLDKIRENTGPVQIPSNEQFRLLEYSANLSSMYLDHPAFTVTSQSDAFEIHRFKFKAPHIERMYMDKFV